MNVNTCTDSELLDRVTADAKVGIYDVQLCSALAARQMSDDELLDCIDIGSIATPTAYSRELDRRRAAKRAAGGDKQMVFGPIAKTFMALAGLYTAALAGAMYWCWGAFY